MPLSLRNRWWGTVVLWSTSTVAAELYGLRPEEFTAVRDARAATAREAGQRAEAKRNAALHKPTRAVWAANRLARADADRARHLLEIGQGLREAHRTLSGEDLRRLPEPEPEPEPEPDPEADTREVERTSREAEPAEEALVRAETERAQARTGLGALDEEIGRLEERLDRARTERERLAAVAEDADRRHREAEREAKAARAAVRKPRRR
ncbi:hypothetical protein ACIOG8_24730 [Streptomyces erythrochromogenes]|uniref:hypothetical protein n=1 Tax=Streptomyces erythrochromogenes TaxID=285574 RepID=UPI00380EED82